MSKDEFRIYERDKSIVFLKTAEKYGGLSNMAPGYPLTINGTKILTSEALYQACRFPHLKHVQQLIFDQKSPMTAKMKSKPYRKDSRKDWDEVRLKVMRWCLRVKLFQNWEKFSELLLQTGQLPIVEESRKDPFWGAIPDENNRLVGTNALGRLLMEIRSDVSKMNGESNKNFVLNPPNIEDFLILGLEVGKIKLIKNQKKTFTKITSTQENVSQVSFFDTSQEKDESKVIKNEKTDNIIFLVNKYIENEKEVNLSMIDFFISQEATDIHQLIDVLFSYKSFQNSRFLYMLNSVLLSENISKEFKNISRHLLAKYYVIHEQLFDKILLDQLSNQLHNLPSELALQVNIKLQNLNQISHLKIMNINFSFAARSKNYISHNFFDNKFQEEFFNDYLHNASNLYDKVNQNKPIEIIVDEFVKNINIQLPNDIEYLCRQANVYVAYFDLPKTIDGFTYKNRLSNRGIIVINRKLINDIRKKFTIAHELGHYILHEFPEGQEVLLDSYHETGLGYSKKEHNETTLKSHVYSKQWEREANYFAELLMVPRGSKYEQLIKNLDRPIIKKLLALSEKWELSLSVLTSKLIKLTQIPMILIIGDNGEIIFSESSKYWEGEKESFYGKSIPDRSSTYDLINSAEFKYFNPVLTNSSNWLNSGSETKIYEEAYATGFGLTYTLLYY